MREGVDAATRALTRSRRATTATTAAATTTTTTTTTTIGGPRTPAKPLTTSHLHRLLQHPFYKGVVRYRGVEYQGSHTALVSEQTWTRVQDALKSKGHSGEKQREHHHYLKGSVYCARCGSRLIITITTNRHNKEYRYFVCLGRHQRRTPCDQKAVFISAVETAVEDHYREIEPSITLVNRLKETIREELGSLQQFAEHEKQIQHRRTSVLRSEQAKLLQAHYADAIPLDVLEAEQGRIGRDLASAEQRMAALDVEHDAISSNLDAALDFAANWNKTYRRAGPSVRRRFNQAIFQKLYVDEEGNVTSDLQEPVKLLLGDGNSADSLEPENAGALNRAWDKMINEPDEQPGRLATMAPLHATTIREGSKYVQMVELRGFEPLTPSLRTRCSAELSYSPNRAAMVPAPGLPDACARQSRAATKPRSGRRYRASRSRLRRSWTMVEVRSARLRSTSDRDTSVVLRKPPVMPSG